MDYYRCENPDCGIVAEEEPDVCPRCGGTFFTPLLETDLTAGDWVNLGNQAVDEERGGEALACYQRAAAMGDLLGLTNLAWCLEAGVGIPADPKQAVVLYAQAAARDYLPALTNLGYCYTYGIGVEKDYAKALECFRKGAEQGFPRAQFQLGEAYRRGNGVEQDNSEAVKWYQSAAWLGYAPAQTELGRCLEFGTGTALNREQAVKWYRAAAEQGNAPGRGGGEVVSVRRLAGLSQRPDGAGPVPGIRDRHSRGPGAGGDMVQTRRRKGPSGGPVLSALLL